MWERPFCIGTPPKNIFKINENLTGKFLQNHFFNRVWPETTIIDEFAIKNRIDSTSQTSKSSSERPKQAKNFTLLDLSCKKSTQISFGMASPYRNATTISPISHPSLLVVYTSNMGHLNMQHPHPSQFLSGIASPYTKPIFATPWYHPSL